MAILEAEKPSVKALRHGLYQALVNPTSLAFSVEKIRQGLWENECTL